MDILKSSGSRHRFLMSVCVCVRMSVGGGEFISIPFFVLLLFPVIADLLVSNRIFHLYLLLLLYLSICVSYFFLSFCVCFGRFFRGTYRDGGVYRGLSEGGRGRRDCLLTLP